MMEAAQVSAKALGHTLKVWRAAADLTLDQLADKLGPGLSASTLSGYEKGKVLPPLAKLQRIAEFYGVAVSVLLSSDGDWPTRAWFHGEPHRQAA